MKTIKAILFVTVLFYIGYLVYTGSVEHRPEVDPRLDSVVTQWEKDVDNIDYQNGFYRLDHIKVVKDLGPACGHYDFGTRTITVSEDRLDAGPYSLMTTVYHELGHYVFKLEHDYSESIMHPNSYSEEYYRENWDVLLSKYLSKCRANEWEAKY